MEKFETTDRYITSFPPKVKKVLKELRKIVTESAPGAQEVISYNMPALKFHGILIYYGAHKEHIGFYPANASTIDLFKDELTGFNTSKGTVQFPLEKPLPVRLIKKIIKLRMSQNIEKENLRIVKRKKS